MNNPSDVCFINAFKNAAKDRNGREFQINLLIDRLQNIAHVFNTLNVPMPNATVATQILALPLIN